MKSNRPHHLRVVGKLRVEGERRSVRYCAETHPGIAYRLFRQGAGIAQAAAAIGVTPEVMEGWLETRPEMEAARLRAQARDGEILQSLEDHAIGTWDAEAGRWTGGNPTLLKFLAKSRLGMTETPKPEPGDDLAGKTPAELQREATVLMRKLEKNREALGLSAADVEYVDRDRDR